MNGVLIDPKDASSLAQLFKLLGSKARLRAVHALALHGELLTGELADVLGWTREETRREMHGLVQRGLVSRRRVGRESAYRLAHAGLVSLLSGSLAIARGLGRNGGGGPRLNPIARRWLDLAPRQREILGLLAEGLSVEDIATKLGITEATARTHVHKILAGLGVRSQLAAVAAVRRQGLII